MGDLSGPPGRHCPAAKTIDGTAVRLTCDRSPGHLGLHRCGTLWWASTDNRSITRDGTTRDHPARPESAEECLRAYAGEGGR